MNNTTKFYDDLDLTYSEIATCLEYTETGVGKFFISVLTPLLENDRPYVHRDKSVNTHNIKNDIKDMEIGPCYESNYISLPLPNGEMIANPGDKFILIFIGGDANKPRLTGRY